MFILCLCRACFFILFYLTLLNSYLCFIALRINVAQIVHGAAQSQTYFTVPILLLSLLQCCCLVFVHVYVFVEYLHVHLLSFGFLVLFLFLFLSCNSVRIHPLLLPYRMLPLLSLEQKGSGPSLPPASCLLPPVCSF